MDWYIADGCYCLIFFFYIGSVLLWFIIFIIVSCHLKKKGKLRVDFVFVGVYLIQMTCKVNDGWLKKMYLFSCKTLYFNLRMIRNLDKKSCLDMFWASHSNLHYLSLMMLYLGCLNTIIFIDLYRHWFLIL